MKKYILMAICALISLTAAAQGPQNQGRPSDEFKQVGDSLTAYLRQATNVTISRTRVQNAVVNKNTLRIDLTNGITDFPITDEIITNLYSIANGLLPESFDAYRGKVKLYADNEPIENLRSNYYTNAKSDVPVKAHAKAVGKNRKSLVPLVQNISKPYAVSAGLQDRHIAMWQSHGWYYEPSLKRWEWQRARCWETVEDLYTQSYVLPFLVPMLENAGAVVMLPRERDWNTEEQVVDNDDSFSAYRESGSWSNAPKEGFANPKASYTFGENPFMMGTARMAQAASKKVALSTASWIPNFSKAGRYAVYVSYQTVPNSTTEARYTVKHKGGETKFKVNQKMGGSTWIYLGTFDFAKGKNAQQGVFLTNETNSEKVVVTADAVKFGGGMGNIARKPSDIDKNGKAVDFQTEAEISHYPRFTEGSRYWLQWAGYNDTIYSYSHGVNDYNDDYMSRPRWVNALIGGSYLDPKKPGYNIPLDLSFAFHTDAGNVLDDSIIGTLAIYTKYSNGKAEYANKESRMNAREYTNIVQTEIVNDIRKNYEPQWQRRQLWDRSYAESRIPEVPAMLLELLSHHNLADMRYGLDPSFRFTVSRAIYKGMVKYLAYINNFDYCIQPLPVNSLQGTLNGNQVNLSWAATEDSAEASAVPTGYIVYTRVDNGGWDNGVAVQQANYSASIEEGHIYSFKVSAFNAGGESFPSDITSVGIAAKNAPVALVINNFDRVSAPVSFASRDSSFAGFLSKLDDGVPYIQDISFIGTQYEFRRHIPWMDDDSCGFGSSNSDYETKVVAGNTGDYAAVHGKALMHNGYSFVTANRSAVNAGKVSVRGYALVDVICGKQITTLVGRKGVGHLKYEIFTPGIQKLLSDYAAMGGNIFISGAYIGSDLWEPIYDYQISEQMKKEVIEPAKEFVKNVLHYTWMTNQATNNGEFFSIQNPLGFNGQRQSYKWQPKQNGRIYCVESPDGIVPAGEGAYSIFRYGNSVSAGVAYKGNHRVVSLGVPFEVLSGEKKRNQLMAEVLRFLNK